MCTTCQELNIPEKLWTKEKTEDPNFGLNEKIFRRFNVNLNSQDRKSLPATIFPLRQDSYIRELYCDTPEDVLYNTIFEDCGKHYLTHGIIVLDNKIISDINANLLQNPVISNDVARYFELVLKHDPVPCMYSHTEVLITENGVPVNPKAPKSIGSLVRDLFMQNLTIHKDPELLSA